MEPKQTTEQLVEERGKVHGDFSDVSQVGQALKSVARMAPNWQGGKLQSLHKEALDMILHKVARILCGDPDETDHWKDIGGYAKITETRLGRGLSANLGSDLEAEVEKNRQTARDVLRKFDAHMEQLGKFKPGPA